MADRTVAVLSSAKALRLVGAGAARGIFSKPVTQRSWPQRRSTMSSPLTAYVVSMRQLLNRPSRRQRTKPKRHLKFESLENRQLFSVNTVTTSSTASAVESIDGTGNNLVHTSWGSTNTDLLRIAAAAYADGISTPAGANRPDARAISNAVMA